MLEDLPNDVSRWESEETEYESFLNHGTSVAPSTFEQVAKLSGKALAETRSLEGSVIGIPVELPYRLDPRI